MCFFQKYSLLNEKAKKKWIGFQSIKDMAEEFSLVNHQMKD